MASGEDDFRFVLSREEFIDLFLDDLELPDLAKKRVTTLESEQWRRAGYMVAGSPANLALKRTMQNSLSRRIALRRPRLDDLEEIRAQILELEESGGDEVQLAWLRDKLAALDSKTRRVPYIDPIDLRYRRFERYPKPIAQAVMFCLMDVSGSMTEHMKDLAKRFFMLLHLFLSRRYRHVEVVFIRHTHEAKEVDEETFFHGTETGGTLVSSAFEEMRRVVTERFSPQDWNIYAAQVSDGDNSSTDAARTERLVIEEILPPCSISPISRSAATKVRGAPALWRRKASCGALMTGCAATGRKSRCGGPATGGRSTRCSAICFSVARRPRSRTLEQYRAEHGRCSKAPTGISTRFAASMT